jgi:hypothetical protein
MSGPRKPISSILHGDMNEPFYRLPEASAMFALASGW